MRTLVTGGAGFIGSNLVDRLLDAGHEVVVFDNFSTGRREFLTNAASERVRIVEGDILDAGLLTESLEGCDVVFHLAANADVRFGINHPEKDIQQNTFGTFSVLEAMRKAGSRRIVFASTGSVYGEPEIFPTPEDAPFPKQTSLYGASKLAGEGMISAYCEGFGFEGYIFRFVSILGERYTHGHIFDFCRSLLRDPLHLRVLGDGKQRKSYLYVQDCIDAILTGLQRGPDRLNVFNLGTASYCEVNESVRWITDRLGLSPAISHAGGQRGWIGDSPFIFLDCARIRSLGWNPRLTIKEAVLRTVDYLSENRNLLDERA